jgi:type II secretory pathway pseudopilin PulG
MLFDVLVALSIVLSLAATLAIATSRRAASLQASRHRISAVAAAERAISRMQADEPIPPEHADDITVAPLDTPAPAADWRWVRVKATHGRRDAALVALVPARSVQAFAPDEGGTR